jgi:phosphatidate phosphatase LPIN
MRGVDVDERRARRKLSVDSMPGSLEREDEEEEEDEEDEDEEMGYGDGEEEEEVADDGEEVVEDNFYDDLLAAGEMANVPFL